MKLTLNEIKSLVSQIIYEGYQDDLAQLKKKFPGEAAALEGAPFTGPKGPKWVAWLAPRYLTGKIREPLPLEHTAFTIKDFAAAEQRLGALWNQPAFVELVDAQIPPAGRRWRGPTDITNMSAGEMDALLQLAAQAGSKKRDRLGIDYDSVDVSGDRLGQVGPWTLWMPSTRENSCAIVRVRDLRTGQMGPSPCTWCTARTEGSNLFYNYVARPGQNIILFYIIKEGASAPNDFISIGFINNKPIMDGSFGGITVNCQNEGLKEADLKRIFDTDHEQIMNILVQKSKAVKGKHPAKAKIEAATQSIDALQYLIKGLGKEEQEDAINLVLNQENVSPEVLEFLSNFEWLEINRRLVANPNCPPHVLEKLSKENDIPIKYRVALNPNSPANALIELFKSKTDYIQGAAFNNPNFPEDIKENNWESLINHENERIIYSVARDPRCPQPILEKLSNSDDYTTKICVAKNPKCPWHILEKFSDFSSKEDPKLEIRIAVASNLNSPKELLEKLSIAKRKEIRISVAQNPNCPLDTLKKLSKDPQVSKTAIRAAKKRKIQLESYKLLQNKIMKLIKENL